MKATVDRCLRPSSADAREAQTAAERAATRCEAAPCVEGKASRVFERVFEWQRREAPERSAPPGVDPDGARDGRSGSRLSASGRS
jgi:hypothetical protein